MSRRLGRSLLLNERRTLRMTLMAVSFLVVIELIPSSEKSLERSIAKPPSPAWFLPESDLPATPPISSSPHPVNQGVDQLSQFAQAASAGFKSGKLNSYSKALELTDWLRMGNRMGWCNSLLVEGPQCRRVDCLIAVNGYQVDLRTQPFQRAYSKNMSCMEPLGGQRPSDPAIQPEVSFIMTTRDNDALAAQALLELFRTAQEASSVQFVVYDDASRTLPELVPATLASMRQMFKTSVVYVRGEGTPLGYGAANHKAIQAASGQYIALVSVLTFVTPGWLASLIFTVQQYPSVGLAGPLHIGPGHLITEAGGALFSDGETASSGVDKEPNDEFLYARLVDYISASCIFMPRQLYFDVGAFDLQYKGGYFQDADLAMAVRKAGRQILYQPGSVVYREVPRVSPEVNALSPAPIWERTSCSHDSPSLSSCPLPQGGKDVNPLETHLMAESGAMFAKKWANDLSRGGYLHKSNQPTPDVAVQRYSMGPVLWVRAGLPGQRDGGADRGGRRNERLMRSLLEAGYQVKVLPIIPSRWPVKAVDESSAAPSEESSASSEWINSTHFLERAAQMRIRGGDVLEPLNTLQSWNLMSSSYGGKTVRCLYRLFIVSEFTLYQSILNAIRVACPKLPVVLDAPSFPFIRTALRQSSFDEAGRRGIRSAFGSESGLSRRLKEAAAIQDLEVASLGPASDEKRQRGPIVPVMEALTHAHLIVTSSKVEAEALKTLLEGQTSRPGQLVLSLPHSSPTFNAPSISLLHKSSKIGCDSRSFHAIFVDSGRGGGGGTPLVDPPREDSMGGAGMAFLQKLLPLLWSLSTPAERSQLQVHFVGTQACRGLVEGIGDGWMSALRCHDMSNSTQWQLEVDSSRVLAAPLFPAPSLDLLDAALMGLPRGLPLLTSSIAATLFGMKPGVECVVSDDDSPAKWADAMIGVMRCQTTGGLWDQLSRGGLAWSERAKEGDSDMRRLTNALSGFIGRGHGGAVQLHHV